MNSVSGFVWPRKSLGQHFLFDPSILERVAGATGSLDGLAVIEVGPGPGGLTRALLGSGASLVIAVEKDGRFAETLRLWPETGARRLVVVQADACAVDWPGLLAQHGVEQARIISNLPYNVGSRLLAGWIKDSGWCSGMALMLQREVAERVCALPGGRDYGRLSVLISARMRVRVDFSLPPGAFCPRPKVHSSLVVLEPLPSEEVFADMVALEAVCGAAFSQRRKMLRKALRPLLRGSVGDVGEWMSGLGLDSSMRAESLCQAEFRILALAYRRFFATTGN